MKLAPFESSVNFASFYVFPIYSQVLWKKCLHRRHFSLMLLHTGTAPFVYLAGCGLLGCFDLIEHLGETSEILRDSLEIL